MSLPPTERRCPGTTGEGQPCTAWTIEGTSACASHGGRSQAVDLVKARRREDARVARRLEARHLEPIGNPVSELLTLCAEAKTFKDILADQLPALAEFETIDDRGARRIRAIVEAYERAVDRLGRFLTDMVRLDLEARLVRIQSLEVERVGKAVLDALGGEDPEAVARIKARLAENLRELG